MRIGRWLLVPAGVVLVGAALLAYRSRPDALAMQALGTTRLPASVRVEACKGWGLTDVLYTCRLSLDPDDLPMLLSRRRWTATSASGPSHSFASGPKVGEDFQVAEGFTATPPEFKNGGQVQLVLSLDHRRAQIDYYEE